MKNITRESKPIREQKTEYKTERQRKRDKRGLILCTVGHEEEELIKGKDPLG
jgi:hypothetical protein